MRALNLLGQRRCRSTYRQSTLRYESLENRRCLTVTFESGQLLGDAVSRDVALGDLDGDGDLDIFVANGVLDSIFTSTGTSVPNEVWLNDGSGNFVDSQQRLGNSTSTSVELGDIDGDGHVDAVVTNEDGDVAFWMNDGRANFEIASNTPRTFTGRVGLLKDLDSDGDLDLVHTGSSLHLSGTTIWLNDGHANFVQADLQRERPWLGGAENIAVGDVDSDGDLDILFAGSFRPTDHLLRFSDGDLSFPDEPANRPFGYQANGFHAELVDVDGDEDLDILAPGDSAPNVWTNNGDGQFSGQRPMSIAEDPNDFFGTGVTTGDFDIDGDVDALIVFDGGNHLWVNDGNGLFTDSGLRLGGSTSVNAAVGDIDNDGDMDAVVANVGPNAIWINQTNPIPGDSNHDGVFNAADFVQVFTIGEYEDDIPGNSTWEDGDWNGDRDFDSSDLVLAFQAGHYEAAAKPLAAEVAAVVDWLFATAEKEDDKSPPFVDCNRYSHVKVLGSWASVESTTSAEVGSTDCNFLRR